MPFSPYSSVILSSRYLWPLHKPISISISSHWTKRRSHEKTNATEHSYFPFYPTPNKPLSMLATLNLTCLSVPGGRLRQSSERCSLSANRRSTSIRAFVATATDSRRTASLYKVLRVKQNATAMEIKSAYRSLAKVYHPDSAVRRSESGERDFIEIHDAYETLSDPSARALYDITLMMATHGGGGRSRSSLSYSGGSFGSYLTRRWETDQCW